MRMSFHPASRPVADPSELVTVHVVTAKDGTHTLHDAYSSIFAQQQWPAWQVPAAAELVLNAPHDPGTLLRMTGHPYYADPDGDGGTPKPAALRIAGDAVLSHAENMRKARWSGLVPSCRGIFHEYEKNPPPDRYGNRFFHARTETVLTMLVEAHDALVHQPTTDGEEAARERCEELVFWIGCATRYASVPPSREAELVRQGYTVAEFLIHCAAGWVLSLATAYERVQGPNAAAFASVARKARISAIEARQVIERGVRYTLERQPQE